MISRKLNQHDTDGSFHQIAEMFSNTSLFGKYPHNSGFKKRPYSKRSHKREVSITVSIFNGKFQK